MSEELKQEYKWYHSLASYGLITAGISGIVANLYAVVAFKEHPGSIKPEQMLICTAAGVIGTFAVIAGKYIQYNKENQELEKENEELRKEIKELENRIKS